MMMAALLRAALVGQANYKASLTSFDPIPVLSFLGGSSEYEQTFNPSWVVASAGTGGKSGLLIRSSNCCSTPGTCRKCNFAPCDPGGPCQDMIIFAELLSNDNDTATTPTFKKATAADVVMAPILSNTSMDNRGVQDPRVAFDPQSGLYYMFYTCYNTGKTGWNPFFLCMAVSTDPTDPSKWTSRKAVFPQHQGSKSAAVLIRKAGPHFMYWGAGVIRITSTSNLTDCASEGLPFISNTSWGNPHVESGPPPLQLSDGNYVFFHNSWGGDAGYQPAWVVIDGKTPVKILSRANQPLWSPSKENWMEGTKPALCNFEKVAFLEAAHPTGTPDESRVYFGGEDSAIGTAVVKFSISSVIY